MARAYKYLFYPQRLSVDVERTRHGNAERNEGDESAQAFGLAQSGKSWLKAGPL
jgi:hypothetical protein